MPELSNLVAFPLISLGMVLTPGPNMIYVISRSISQEGPTLLRCLNDDVGVTARLAA